MKKAIIAILLTSVLSAAAFAQVLFSGEVFAGIQLQRNHNENETIGTYHRDEGAPRFDFTATVVRENYGARLDTSFQMFNEPDRHVTLNGIYGWVNLPGLFGDDSFRLTMGQISSPAWVTRLHADLPEHYLDKIRGFRIEYATPMPGLSVGAAFRTTGADGNNYDLETFAKNMIFGANFIHPMFSAVFAWDVGGNAQTIFGFNFTGIPDLTAGLQLRANRLASWDDPPHGYPGMLQVHYKVGYRIMRPLFTYLIFGQRFHGQSGVGPYWEITPGVEYSFLPNLTGSFSVTLDNFEGNPLFGGTPNNNLTLRPALELMLAGPAFFYAEYVLRMENMERNYHTFGFGITIRAF
ncbi:MAG: hypothetical protein FWC64_00980 [Treponema sp.]|nr:hypothetical protein [Treponema sp.]